MEAACREKMTLKAGYRADIDGLRAIAVLSVMGFHYHQFIRSGFTGVDVFFVISGFLITQFLLSEIAAGSFSVLNFYDRRIRRIMPALLAMLTVVLFSGRFLLAPGDYSLLADSTAASAFGASNFFFNSHTGYFDGLADLMPLLHTWSLAVEEQFYVVWPLLLLALSTWTSRNFAAITLAILVVAGCVGSIVYFQYEPKGAFFMALPRAWELGLGALLVFLPALSRGSGEAAAVVGLILVGIGMTALSPGRFPGPYALCPCVGAALIVWPRAEVTISARLLGLLAPIGLISYSLYLWHWPVLVYYRIYTNDSMPHAREFAVLATVSFVLAYLSYRFVERPFRGGRWSPPRVVTSGLAAATVIFCASMYIDSADGLPQRLSASAQPMRNGAVMWNWPCNEVAIEGIPGNYCVFGAPWQTAKRKTIIWGDSHAQHFAPIINAINTDPDRSFLVYSGCTAALGREIFLSVSTPDYPERCRSLYSNGVKLLKADPSISQVIFTSNWIELPWRAIGHSLTGVAALNSGLTTLIEETEAPDRRFLLIGTVPHIPLGLADCAVLQGSTLWRKPCSTAPQPSETRVIKDNSAPTEQMLIDVARKFDNVSVIIPTKKMCTDETCDLYQDGEFLYRDSGHIRRNLHRQTMIDFAKRIGLTDALADGSVGTASKAISGAAPQAEQ
jgi:peptidoglycan/LPS O-acetylase OafA/YrhL